MTQMTDWREEETVGASEPSREYDLSISLRAESQHRRFEPESRSGA